MALSPTLWRRAEVLSTGGYNSTINTANNNPLNGRSAWVGIYDFWQTVTVNLPAVRRRAKHPVALELRHGLQQQQRHRRGGWYVDSISITDGVPNCLSVFTDLAASQSLATNSLTTGQNLVYTLTVTNLGPQPAANVMFTDTVPANVTFVSASSGCSFAAGTCDFAPSGLLPVAAAPTSRSRSRPLAGNVFTNVVGVGTITPEINTANNTATLVSTQIFHAAGEASVSGRRARRFNAAAMRRFRSTQLEPHR